MNATCSPSPGAGPAAATSEIDASCRVPLFVLFISAAFWLVVASVLGLIASLKFHSPNLLANCPCFAYGRLHPAATHALLYGFALQAGLGVALWILARLGPARAEQPWLIGFGGKLWNLGVLVGLVGILAGDSTGFEFLELPRYAAVILFLAYLVIGFWTLLTFHGRAEYRLQPSQWFLVAALFWFPWIFSTAQILLNWHPVRGMTQAVVAWWYAGNLQYVWLGLVGIATIFYFVQQGVNRRLHSPYLALFTFWTLILFASWTGIPSSAPVPAWMPTLSTIATGLTVLTVLTVMLNVCRTVGADCASAHNAPGGKFFKFGTMTFAVAWLLNIAAALPGVSDYLTFTWFGPAQWYLNVFGFFSMTMFGAIYAIVPQVTGIEWPKPKLVRAHYGLAALGILLFAAPLLIGGALQGFRLNQQPTLDLVLVTKGTLPFLRVSTLGELCVLLGNLLLLANLTALSVRYYRTHFAPVYAAATAELKPAEVKP